MAHYADNASYWRAVAEETLAEAIALADAARALLQADAPRDPDSLREAAEAARALFAEACCAFDSWEDAEKADDEDED